MKRILVILFTIVLISVFTFSGCKIKFDFDIDDDTLPLSDNWNKFSKDSSNEYLLDDLKEDEMRGAWFSYLELNPRYIKEQTEYEKYLDDVFINLKKAHVNTLFVQVRAFCDAIYPTENFESADYVVNNRADELPFDFFDVIIKKASEYKMTVHAWINPYRISTSSRQEKIGKESRLGKLIEENGGDVLKTDSGLFLNPASLKAQQLIIDGVRELFDGYDIKGIHLDDYFYPTTDKSFDKVFYTDYVSCGGTMSLDDWRRENVNNLIGAIYSVAKSSSPSHAVSISPCGDIEKNYSVHYADVKKWCSESGYLDIIMPQIYFGFENQTMPFEATALQWKRLCEKTNVKICPGLALYKVGSTDSFAGTGTSEWLENDDIISRQVRFLRENGFDGYCLFSAKFVNFNKKVMKNELKNLCDALRI